MMRISSSGRRGWTSTYRVFDPLTDLTGLVAAYVASDLGLTAGQNVSSFTNSEGTAARDLSSVSATPPTFQTSLISQGAVRFVKGSSTYLRRAFTLAHDATTGAKRTYIVASVNAGFAWGDSLVDGFGSGKAFRHRVKTTATFGALSTSGIDEASNFVAGTPQIYTVLWKGASSTVAINGNADATGTLAAADAAGITMGSITTVDSAFVSADIACLYICDGNQTGTEHADMLSFLASTYGITL